MRDWKEFYEPVDQGYSENEKRRINKAKEKEAKQTAQILNEMKSKFKWMG